MDGFLFVIAGIVIILLIYWVVRNDGSANNEDEFVKLQDEYVAAKIATQTAPDTFDMLPIFPFRLPYYFSRPDITIHSFQNQSMQALDEIMTEYLILFRSYMPNSMYFRGDNHAANGEFSRVLLIVEEVKQSGCELAIVAFVVEKRGVVASLSVRYGFFPNTIHKVVPRRPWVTDKVSDCDLPWTNDKSIGVNCNKTRRYYRYFAPIWWKTEFRGREYGGRREYCRNFRIYLPEFRNETMYAAKTLAGVISEIIAETLKDKPQ